MMTFTTHRDAALALLNDPDHRLTRKAGQFLGQVAVDDFPLTEKQREWLDTLLDRAGQPALAAGGRHD